MALGRKRAKGAKGRKALEAKSSPPAEKGETEDAALLEFLKGDFDSPDQTVPRPGTYPPPMLRL